MHRGARSGGKPGYDSFRPRSRQIEAAVSRHSQVRSRLLVSGTAGCKLSRGTWDRFFARMRVKARKLDHGEKLQPGVTVSFEDPADLLEVITPARVRILREIDGRTVAIFALAAALSRDPSAVRRDVALLESKHLVRTRKVPNPVEANGEACSGTGNRLLADRVAESTRPTTPASVP